MLLLLLLCCTAARFWIAWLLLVSNPRSRSGGIAAGKSTASDFFRARGVPVIDADQVAREVVQPGSPGLAQVVAAFGPEVLQADGARDYTVAPLPCIAKVGRPRRRSHVLLAVEQHLATSDMVEGREQATQLSPVRLSK